MEPVKVEVVKPDSVIDLPVSEPFYKRIQNLAVYFTTLRSPEQIQEVVQNLSTLSETDDFAQNFETVLILAKSLEEAAKAQGKTELLDIPTPAQA